MTLTGERGTRASQACPSLAVRNSQFAIPKRVQIPDGAVVEWVENEQAQR